MVQDNGRFTVLIKSDSHSDYEDSDDDDNDYDNSDDDDAFLGMVTVGPSAFSLGLSSQQVTLWPWLPVWEELRPGAPWALLHPPPPPLFPPPEDSVCGPGSRNA
jgi:hypothetical protein